MTEILYKYRSISNFKNFVDIIVNNRLYAANFESLNDPMEGHYFYDKSTLDEKTRKEIYDKKSGLKICSLSKNSNNYLLWSHYAEGYRGVSIGVKLILIDIL